MKFAQLIGVMFCLSWLLSCTTYHYYPTYEMGIHKVSAARDALLRNVRLKMRCIIADDQGKHIPATDLCSKLTDWISLHNGQVSGEDEKAALSARPELEIVVLSTGLIKPPESLESVLHIISYGFYPTQTDHWFSTEIRIFNEHHQLLEHGQFKVLIREYYGWGYRLLHYALNTAGLIEQEDALVHNSSDFYAYFGELLGRARSENRISSALPDQGVEP